MLHRGYHDEYHREETGEDEQLRIMTAFAGLAVAFLLGAAGLYILEQACAIAAG